MMKIQPSLLPLLLPALALAACSPSSTVEPGDSSRGSAESAALEEGAVPTVPPAEDAPMPDSPVSPSPDPTPIEPASTGGATEVATLGAGCFWCVEAVLEQLDGVVDVTSGYMGGHLENPTYKAVCTGATGHAEVVQVTFDPAVLPYEELLDWFWRLHDPTTLNRQGADVGTQYRSAIFVHSPAQREKAEASKAAAQASFASPIVTEITDAGTYYLAEDYHQDYYVQNKSQGYCRAVIRPKLEKLELEH